MATMIRVKPLAAVNGATVSAAATLGVCATDEIAVMVGTGVARQRLGSEVKEAMKLLAVKPKPALTVVAGSVRTYLGLPGLTADALFAAGATAVNATVPTETQVGLVVGANAALSLDKTDLVLAAVLRALDSFPVAFGH